MTGLFCIYETHYTQSICGQSFNELYQKFLNHTSVILSKSLFMVSRLWTLALSIASSFTSTASIFDTMLPMECSIRSTRRLSLRKENILLSRSDLRRFLMLINHGAANNKLKFYTHIFGKNPPDELLLHFAHFKNILQLWKFIC